MARKNKTDRKNLVIILLVVLLLALALGYAAFSETLTITGTANAKGSFDLEFQNADVVKSSGVNAENTKAVISADRNTLTVTVADLAYPGAGAEFTTDIVNVGSVPAKVEAVTPFDMEGSDNLKNAINIKGLDVITTDHPTLASGERCNIHFIVEWDKDATAKLGDADGNITFGLTIQYTQKTDEPLEATPSHSDGTSSSNTVAPGASGNTVNPDNSGNTITPPVTEPEEPTPDDSDTKTGNLTEIITGADYGKKINYSVTVNGQTIDSWRIFSNNGTTLKIISTDCIPQTAIPQAALDAGLELVDGRENCVIGTSPTKLVAGLTTGWEEYAKEIEGATATGSPTYNEFVVSWNANDETKSKRLSVGTLYSGTNNGGPVVDSTTKIEENGLYTLTREREAYWLASVGGGSGNVWTVNFTGRIDYTNYGTNCYGVRPVVSIPSSILGTVGDTVTIQK